MLPPSIRRAVPLLGYTLAWPVLIICSFTVGGLVIDTVNRFPHGSWLDASWVDYAINLGVPAICGIVGGSLIAYALKRRGRLEATLRAHVARLWPTYAVACLCAISFARGWGTDDFGLWAQIPLWAGLTFVGVVIADGAISELTRRAVIKCDR